MPAYVQSGLGTLTTVASGTTAVTILAANTNGGRKGALIVNTDANALHILMAQAASTVTTTNCSDIIAAGGRYEVPCGYQGAITGIWAADGTGSALVTEFT